MNFAERVRDTTSTTGTGAITLAGAPAADEQSFAAAFPVGTSNIGYCIAGGAQFEMGRGTLTASNTLSRDEVFYSSSGGAKVNFGAGTKTVFVYLSAVKAQQAVNASSPRRVSLLQIGCVGDADLSLGSTTFGTDVTAIVQALLNTASASSPLEVIVDGAFSTTGLRAKGNTKFTVLPGCGFILRTGSNKSLLENYNLVFNGAPADKNIEIRGGIWNGNGGVDNANNIKGNSTVGLVCCMRFYGVAGLKVYPDALLDSPSYALHVLNATDYSTGGYLVDVGTTGHINQDGAHADGNCERVRIHDITLRCHDDAIALNADDVFQDPGNFVYGYYPVNANGPIKKVDIERITLNSLISGIRLLSGASRIDDVHIKGLRGQTRGYAVVMDAYQPSITSYSGAGNFGKTVLEDINVEVLDDGLGYGPPGVITAGANHEEIKITNLRRDSFLTTFQRPTVLIRAGFGARPNIKRLIIEGYDSYDASSNIDIPHILLDGCTVNELSLSDISIHRGGSSIVGTLVKTANGASVDVIRVNGVVANRLSSILENASGTVGQVIGTGVAHIGSSSPTFNTASTIPLITLSNWSGATPTGGTWTTKNGDAFTSAPAPSPSPAPSPAPSPSPPLWTGATRIGFANDGTLVNTSEVYSLNGTTGTTYKGFLGSGSTVKLPAGTAGRLILQAGTPATASHDTILAFSTSASATLANALGLTFAVAAGVPSVRKVEGGSAPTAITVTAGNWYSVRRVGSTITVEEATAVDGSWTVIATLTATSSADLYVMCMLYTDGTMLYPQGIGLTA